MKHSVQEMFKLGIYAITPDIDNLNRLVHLVEGALSGGVRLFQYRNKVSSPIRKLIAAQRINEIILKAGGYLIINDDPQLVKLVNASGVHLGKNDQSLEAARDMLGPHKIIGVSCYDNLEMALDMQSRGADYVAFGAFFPSLSKASATPVSPCILQRAVKNGVHLPVVAIGGVKLDNAEELLSQGPCTFALINGLFGAKNVAERANDWIRLYDDFR